MTTIINMLFNNSMPHVYKLIQEYLELQKEKKRSAEDYAQYLFMYPTKLAEPPQKMLDF